jgi:hypothetical protein
MVGSIEIEQLRNLFETTSLNNLLALGSILERKVAKTQRNAKPLRIFEPLRCRQPQPGFVTVFSSLGKVMQKDAGGDGDVQ